MRGLWPTAIESTAFRVGVTRDFLNSDGKIGFGDIGLPRLGDAPGIHWEFLADNVHAITREHAEAYDALLVTAPASDGRDACGHAPTGAGRPVWRRLRQHRCSGLHEKTASR